MESKPELQDHFINCGDAKISVRSAGDSGARVVFVSAFPGMLLDWSLVQPEIATFARTISYDRAGVGKSSKFVGEVKTPDQYITELNCVVADASEEPVVLVAHSAGGVIARRYYLHFPYRVRAMVLVDSSHEQQNLRLDGGDAELKAMEKGLRAELRLARLGILKVLTKIRGRRMIPPSFQNLPKDAKTEFLDNIASAKQCRASLAEVRALKFMGDIQPPNLDNLPLIVLESTQNRMEGWHDLQQELTNLSSRSELRSAVSDHYIQLGDPQSVVQAVRDVLV